ncbi:ABC transporter permease [Oleiagrimonas soli]|uniref:ABC transporter permease n=1 Tax=Oleiagrimonas soli TaxID=1543381 RepID=A0A099D0C9_9GAMM|nr:FtsX-like permease family protein [Oleiagrimonas soli]KGI78735.1 ABC transporter permease [Oleiagrimonas soli]MBB6184115.1 putative ABC transport system permease protein [Oleiagrimonas soli]
MQIRPILAALKSHRAAVTLLVLEIALTMAVLGNLVFIVHDGIRRAHTPTGVAENQIGFIQSIGVIGAKSASTTAGDLAALRGVPGVEAAAYGGPPLWYVERDAAFAHVDRLHRVARIYEFEGSRGLSKTLGLHVVEGRDFERSEVPVMGQMDEHTQFPVLVTRALAQRLFPDGSALGQLFYDGNATLRVIGVVDHLRGRITGHEDDDYSAVIEYGVGKGHMGGGFIIRSRPEQLDSVLKQAAIALSKADPQHVQNRVMTFEQMREHYFRSDLAVGRMLLAIVLILMIVTTLGVTGLANFWVQQRRRQIGMRRALGATRGDILRYFQLENFLIVSGGVLLGAICTYGLNLFLMHRFELPQLPPIYLLVGAAVLWGLSQLAVFGPALRASRVPPVVATRSA